MVQVTYGGFFGAAANVSEGVSPSYFFPELTVLDDGTVAVAFTAAPFLTAYLRMFNPAGTVKSDLIGIAPGANFSFTPNLFPLNDGSLNIAYIASETPALFPATINAQAFSANGDALGESAVLFNNAEGPGAILISSTNLVNGGSVSVLLQATGLTDDDGFTIWNVVGQIADTNGDLVGVPFQIDEVSDGDHSLAEVTALADGGFAVVMSNWDLVVGEAQFFGPFPPPYLRVYNADGTTRTPELQLDARGRFADIATLTDGRFVVVWEGEDGETTVLRAQIYAATGVAEGPAFAICETHDGSEALPSIAATPEGGFAIAWRETDIDTPPTIVMQTYDATGEKIGAPGSFSVSGERPEFSPMQFVISDDGITHLAFVSEDATESPQDVYLITSGVTKQGTNGADTLIGTAAGDQLIGQDGDDLFEGQGGDDLMRGGNGVDTMFGGEGNDFIIGGNGNDLLQGGNGNDNLAGSGGNDTLAGGDGDDIARGEAGNDLVIGGAGNDILSGQAGVDRIEGGDGNDRISGGSQGDFLFGNKDDDDIEGGGGNDEIFGGFGNDNLRGNTGNDRVIGQDGDDLISGASGDDFLSGGKGTDVLRGGSGADQMYGGLGDDTLGGDSGNDVLIGNEGNDTLLGGGGNDRLAGGDGEDILVAGTGADTLSGGATLGERDVFVFGPAADGHGGFNRIVDFENGVDQIDLSAFGFTDFATDVAGLAGKRDAGTATALVLEPGYVIHINGLTLGAFDASDVILA